MGVSHGGEPLVVRSVHVHWVRGHPRPDGNRQLQEQVQVQPALPSPSHLPSTPACTQWYGSRPRVPPPPPMHLTLGLESSLRFIKIVVRFWWWCEEIKQDRGRQPSLTAVAKHDVRGRRGHPFLLVLVVAPGAEPVARRHHRRQAEPSRPRRPCAQPRPRLWSRKCQAYP